ncbi:MAG TPA: acetate--CoA ligase family protein [Xanthobacteraceae bacterium]|nr:acetate--CoA ligase family protein [Xanthobacteraceae bacterium]
MAEANTQEAPGGAAIVELLMQPRSVAIIGMSSKPGSAGHTVLANLKMNNFAGDIYLVGRSGGEIEGIQVLKTVDELPEGVDIAVFTLPAAGVKEALEGCVRRKVKSAVVFSSGFAEIGERDAQDELARIARDGNLALIGPNCLGYTNFVDGFAIGFAGATVVPKIESSRDPAVAIVSQSGGLAGHIRSALDARDIPTSYNISTGNEAGLGLADFIDYLAKDKLTSAIVVYVEEFRQTEKFIAAAARARDAGKPILLLSPGRGEKSKAAVSSHTGALAGDYEVMRTIATHAGIAVIDTLDELIDTAELLARYPNPPTEGLAVVTFSGAFCAIAHDFADDLGIEIPSLSPETEAHLKPLVPSFIPPKNPLDLGTQPIWQPELLEIGPKALLGDPKLGGMVISSPLGNPSLTMKYLDYALAAVKAFPEKPFIWAPLGDRAPLMPEFEKVARENRMLISRSSDRSLRAMANATFYARARERSKLSVKATPIPNLPPLGKGTLPEWVGKQVLKAAGIKIPDGQLAKTMDEAVSVANKIGFPVVMKAQASELAHKTEAGGVLLNIADEKGVRDAWAKLESNVQKAQPGVKLDGILVEKMAAKGLELVVGAKRDPLWGPVVLVGLGGIWVEALGDVRLLPPDLPEAEIVKELQKLRTAKLLNGFRGAPAVDVEAVARTAALVGRIMQTVPEIQEIDINPVFAHPKGEGVTALDALIVTA